MIMSSLQKESRKKTIKVLEIESSFVLNFPRTEVQKFNSRVDRAYARALNLDRMTQESFTKMIPKDMNNNTPSCSGKESGDPVDGLVPKKKTEQTSPNFRYRVKKFFGFQ